eukprot:SAG25_NODE_838_length_5128_cov_5.187314_2_plen_61_part_00
MCKQQSRQTGKSHTRAERAIESPKSLDSCYMYLRYGPYDLKNRRSSSENCLTPTIERFYE